MDSDPDVNYIIIPFEGNMNPVYQQGIKLYLQTTKYIDNEDEKLDILVSNAEDIIYYFLIIANKYSWGRLVFMVETGTGENNIFRQV